MQYDYSQQFEFNFVGTDGGYSKWSDWSACSVTCGGGLMWKRRQCNSPKPSGDGKTCKEQNLGPDKQSKACNTQKCGEPFLILGSLTSSNGKQNVDNKHLGNVDYFVIIISSSHSLLSTEHATNGLVEAPLK